MSLGLFWQAGNPTRTGCDHLTAFRCIDTTSVQKTHIGEQSQVDIMTQIHTLPAGSVLDHQL